MKPSVAILCGYPIRHNMDTVLNNLGRMVSDEFDLHLLVGQNDIPQRLRKYYEIVEIKVKGLNPAGIGYARQACRQFLKRHKPDLMMNITQPHTLGYVVSSIGRKTGIPTVIRMPGDSFNQTHLAEGIVTRFKRWLLHEYLAEKAYTQATRVAAVGENLKNSLQKRGFSGDFIEVIPQPFDTTEFQPVDSKTKASLKQKLGFNPDKKTVLYIGRISWLKGCDRLLQIIQNVVAQTEAYQFCVVGQGDMESRFKREEWSETVIMKRAVPHEQIADYYKAADLFVFPSRTEGLPNTILEALSVRLPIIASPVGEIPHYVSTLSEDTDSYTSYILGGKWTVDPLPAWFDWIEQVRSYKALLTKTIRSFRA